MSSRFVRYKSKSMERELGDEMEKVSMEKEVAAQFLRNLKSLVGNKFIGLRY